MTQILEALFSIYPESEVLEALKSLHQFGCDLNYPYPFSDGRQTLLARALAQVNKNIIIGLMTKIEGIQPLPKEQEAVQRYLEQDKKEKETLAAAAAARRK